MQILDSIAREAEDDGLEFLVIGGHAVIAYGIARNTLDLDLLVSRQDRKSWKSLFEDLRYSIFHEHENFLQFSPPEPRSWPVDLMIVDDPAFRAMLRESREVRLGGVAFKIPKIEHLIALKLHSYKSGAAQREVKDLLDILELTRAAKIDIESEVFKKFCLRYVSLKQYETIRETFHRRGKA